VSMTIEHARTMPASRSSRIRRSRGERSRRGAKSRLHPPQAEKSDLPSGFCLAKTSRTARYCGWMARCTNCSNSASSHCDRVG
jgi:hypothetical protein